MSNDVFPQLPGLTWNQGRTVLAPPTHISTTPSRREFRSRSATLPLYQYTNTYEFLRSGAEQELQLLVGFFNDHGGAFDSFLYPDAVDKTISGQAFGIGSGAQASYQLVRAFGGFVEPVTDLNGAPQVFVDGVLQGGGYTVSSIGVVTLTAAPGAVLTWSGAFYKRVRFMRDQLDTSAFMQDLFEAKKVELLQVLK